MRCLAHHFRTEHASIINPPGRMLVVMASAIPLDGGRWQVGHDTHRVVAIRCERGLHYSKEVWFGEQIDDPSKKDDLVLEGWSYEGPYVREIPVIAGGGGRLHPPTGWQGYEVLPGDDYFIIDCTGPRVTDDDKLAWAQIAMVKKALQTGIDADWSRSPHGSRFDRQAHEESARRIIDETESPQWPEGDLHWIGVRPEEPA